VQTGIVFTVMPVEAVLNQMEFKPSLGLMLSVIDGNSGQLSGDSTLVQVTISS